MTLVMTAKRHDLILGVYKAISTWYNSITCTSFALDWILSVFLAGYSGGQRLPRHSRDDTAGS